MVKIRGNDDSMLLKDMIPGKSKRSTIIKIKVPPNPAHGVGEGSSTQGAIVRSGEGSLTGAPPNLGEGPSTQIVVGPVKKRAQPKEKALALPPAKKSKKDNAVPRGDGLQRLKIRTSPKSLVLFIEGMNDEQKKAVEEMGFGGILQLQVKELPQALGFWLVSNFHTGSRCIKLGQDRHLHVSDVNVKETLGIPLGGRAITPRRTENCPLVERWLGQFGGVSVFQVTITRLIEEMKKQSGAEVMFKWNFIVLFTTLMIEGTSGSYVNHCVLYGLEDADAVSQYDWCGYVIDGLLESQKKWEKSDTGDKFYAGPMTFLMLYYVDRIVLEKRVVDRAQPSLVGWTTEHLKNREQLEKKYGSFGEGYMEKDPYMPKKTDNVIPGTGQEEYIVMLAQQAVQLADSYVVFKETIRTAISKFSDSITIRRLHDTVNEMVGAQSEHDIEEASQDGFWSHPDVIKAIEAAFKAASKVNSQGSGNGNNAEGSAAERENRDVDCGGQGRENLSEEHGEGVERVVELGKDIDVGVEGEDVAEEVIGGANRVEEAGKEVSGAEPQGRGMPTFSLGLGLDVVAEIGRAACQDGGNTEKGTEKQQPRKSRSVKKKEKIKEGVSERPKNRMTDLDSPLTKEEKLWMDWLLNDERGDEWEMIFEVMAGDIGLMKKDLRSMRVGEKLTVGVINAWAAYMNLTDEKRTADEPSRFFFTSVASMEIIDPKKENWEEQLQTELDMYPGADLTALDLVFFPIYSSGHYYLACVNMKKYIISVVDNLEGTNFRGKYGNKISTLRNRVGDYLEKRDATLSVKMKNAKARCVKLDWSSNANKTDCGVYCMFHMERYMDQSGSTWGSPMRKIDADQLAILRHRYVVKLCTHPSNTSKIMNETRMRRYCQRVVQTEGDALSSGSSERTT